MRKISNNFMRKLLIGSASLWVIALLACTQGGVSGGPDVSLDGGNLAQPAEHPSAGRGIGDPTEIPDVLRECQVVGVDENGDPIEKCSLRGPEDFGIGLTDVDLPQQNQPQPLDLGDPLRDRTGPVEARDNGIHVNIEQDEKSKNDFQFDAERFDAVGDRPVFDNIRLKINEDEESEEEEK